MTQSRAWTHIDERLKDFPWVTDRQRQYIDAVNQYQSAAAAARSIGIDKAVVAKSINSIRRRAIAQGYSPDHDMTQTVPEGFKVKGVSTYYDSEGQVRGQWVKSTADSERQLEILRAILEGAVDELPREAPLAAPVDCDAELLTIYPVGDPHAGLYSWRDETGSHFDLAEFERIQKAAIDRLVQSTPRSAVALFNDKGDSTHADNSKNRTPRSGHDLDVHGRHGEVMRVSVRVKRYQIARLLEKHEKIIVRVDPGNHDPESALHLALVLEALYENEPRVEVITSPNPYWYYLFGTNLIGTCHGDGAKGKDLPGIMAHDAREWWGQADYCVWFVGHVHHKDIKEYTGCTVEYLRTLAAPDAYSHAAGYRARRDLEAVTLHRLDAEVERHTCSLKRIERLLAA